MVSDGLASLDLTGTEQTRAEADRQSDEWAKKFNTAKTPEEREKLLDSRKSNDVSAVLSVFPKGTSSMRLAHGLGGGLHAYLLNRQASFFIEDEKGTTRTALGHTKLERPSTGVVEERPASSVVLFDKDGKVIWKEP